MKPDTRLFYRYVFPSMCIMLVSGLYSIVDVAFIGWALGEQGIAACSVTWPLFCLIYSVADMVGVGACILLAQHRGRGEDRLANTAFAKMIGLCAIFGVLVPIGTLPWLHELLEFCGTTPELMAGAISYISIVIGAAAIPIFWVGFSSAIRNDGRPVLTMVLVCTGVLANVLFDALFILVFGWGLPGAAWATVAAEAFPLALASVWYVYSKHTHLKILWGEMIPTWNWTWKILKYGFPSLGGTLSISAMLLFHNWQALRYGELAGIGTAGLAIYAVISTTESLFSMVMGGLANGIQPIVSFIHGTGNLSRNLRLARLAFLFSLVLGLFGMTFSILMRNAIPTLMGLEGNVVAQTAHGLVLSAPAFLVLGLVRVGSSFFQSTGRITTSTLLVYGDYCLVLPACLVFLPMRYGLAGVWLAMPVSRFILAGMLLFFWIHAFGWRSVLSSRWTHPDADGNTSEAEPTPDRF